MVWGLSVNEGPLSKLGKERYSHTDMGEISLQIWADISPISIREPACSLLLILNSSHASTNKAWQAWINSNHSYLRLIDCGGEGHTCAVVCL